jgi:thiol-disulfide isomerase/thioredoxin
MMRLGAMVFVSLVGLAGVTGWGQGMSKEVSLQVVSYRELGNAVKAQKGKVVVVDVWASWCVPCKKEFPHLIALHNKYSADGLVCMSASVDKAGKTHDSALKFLIDRKATFANYRVDEDFASLCERWDIKGIPAVFVFNRDGKREKKYTHDDPDKPFDYEKDVEPLVRRLLSEKKSGS